MQEHPGGRLVLNRTTLLVSARCCIRWRWSRCGWNRFRDCAPPNTGRAEGTSKAGSICA